jgi:SAM-dependent methyltransferase
MVEIDAHKTNALATVIERHHGHVKKVLVVGRGSGQEAGILALRLDAEVIGIDISDRRFDEMSALPAALHVMDATNLDFDDASFDFVFSFHALEHIPDKDKALEEMQRVLRIGAGYLIGTPNKSRLIGYVVVDVPIWIRARSNVRDWWRRLRGRWENEKGSHAGFTAPELAGLCQAAFGSATEITDEYYDLCYPGKARLLGLLRRTGLQRVVYPCVYITGTVRV